jgi:hypothetical protein
MTIGSLVSIYIVPIIYWLAYRNRDLTQIQGK